MTTTGPTTSASLAALQQAVASDIAIETQAVTLILEIPGLLTAARNSSNPDAALDALTAQLDTAGSTLQGALGGSGQELAISTTSLADATVGAAYTASVATSGGESPVTLSLGGLPTGLVADTAGNITGAATAAPGTYSVSVSASDAGGQAASATLPINVVAAS